MSRYEMFDRQRIVLADLSVRGNELAAADCLDLSAPSKPFVHPDFDEFIDCILAARRWHRPVILMMGGHPIKLGLSRFLIDLMQRRLITHLAMNGAGIIHDYELALTGGTSEDAAKWIVNGQFGLWKETGGLNKLINGAAQRGEGLGEGVGRIIEEQLFMRRDLSLAAAGWRTFVPVTVHVSLGSDIIHAHPNCDGAAMGAATYTDFLILARSIENLEGGVFINIGSAVTGPEVYLKTLAMARNAAQRENRHIRSFTTAVFDLRPLPENYRDALPSKSDHMYYYRPWKTILKRTVTDGGKSYYFAGNHLATIPTLWSRLQTHVA
jgi:hypothetical protein